MSSPGRRLYLTFEFALLFAGLPLVVQAGEMPFHVFIVLWIVSLACLAELLTDRDFDRRQLWHTDGMGRELPRILLRFLPLAALLAAATVSVWPSYLFALARREPWTWALVMVLYPLVSVYPQGLIYRVFLFHRYRPLLPAPWMRIAAASLAFAFMHTVFGNWVAPTITLVGGALFAATYERTGSALLAALEHALYGTFVITLGLGRFVYWSSTQLPP